MPIRSRRTKHYHSHTCLALVSAAVLAAGGLAGCGLFDIVVPPPSSRLSISMAPTGCGVVIDEPLYSSWSVAFIGSGAAAGEGYQWFFSDGGSAAGPRAVHTFDTNGRQGVSFEVTLVAGPDSLKQRVSIPLRGVLDGGPDPDGDTCIPDEGNVHVPTGANICYEHNPPASGNHYSNSNSPAAAGFYDEAVSTPRWVHSIEHGAIVLLYDCGGDCPDELKDQLRSLFDSVPREPLFGQKKVLITRYAGVSPPCTGVPTFPASGPFLAIAWNVQRSFDTLDTEGILAFYRRHVNHGREPERIP